MLRKGLDNRDRDKDGQIDRKHGNTRVDTLRETYGENFAQGYRGDKQLKNLLKDEGASRFRNTGRRNNVVITSDAGDLLPSVAID